MISVSGYPGELGAGDPPLSFDSDGQTWVRTDIARGRDLIDGSAWIQEFKRRCSAAPKPKAGGGRQLQRRTVTDGDQPQFWGKAGEAPLQTRNQVLKEMQAEGIPDPGKQIRLPTGQEVIFWFNVGPPGLPKDRVYVTEAHCPHQGVCLAHGELRDIEDLAGANRALVRCPRHNKQFDLQTGESPGNPTLQLRRFPCRFEHGRWYVGVAPSVGPRPPAAPIAPCLPAAEPAEQPVVQMEDVEMGSPTSKRPRVLSMHMTIG